MYINVMGTRNVLFYFVSFYIIGVLIGMNILVCFAIDMYSSICRLDNQQAAHEKKLLDLAQQVKKSQNVFRESVGPQVNLINDNNEDDYLMEPDIGAIIYKDKSFSVKKKPKKQVLRETQEVQDILQFNNE